MPVQPIKEPTIRDRVWTFLNLNLAIPVVRRLNALCALKVSPDGAGKLEIGEEGAILVINDRSSNDYPYKVYPNGSGLVSVKPGAHNGIIPKIGSNSLTDTPPPTLSVPSGTSYAYAVITTDEDGNVEEESEDSGIEIEIFTSTQTSNDPNEDGTSATFYDLIAQLEKTGTAITINPIVTNSRAFVYCSGMIISY